MNPKVARALRWLFTAVIVAFLVVFARTIDWTAAWTSIRHASMPLLIAAVVVNFLSMAVKGVRWWLFLRPAGSLARTCSPRHDRRFRLNNFSVQWRATHREISLCRVPRSAELDGLATLALERMFDPVGVLLLV